MIDDWRRRGLKLTAPRRAVLLALEGDRSHPSAEEILRRVRRRLPRVSFTTVYATLDELVRQGHLARLKAVDPERARFDTMVHEHDHAVCDVCGAIEDLPSAPRSKGLASRAPAGFRVQSVRLELRGRCAACGGA